MNKLDVIKISKSYDSKKIVSNVSIEVNTGEVIGLLGPNGGRENNLFLYDYWINISRIWQNIY